MPEVHFGQFNTLHFVHPADAVEGDPPQRDETLQARQAFDLCRHPGQAVPDFGHFRAVIGRDAAADRGDKDIAQCEVIIRAVTVGLVGEAGPVERRIEEVPAGVSGEHPPGPVGAVRAGGQANDQDPRLRVAKPGHRFPPVVFILIGLALRLGHFLPPGDQARAAPAGDDLIFKLLQCRCHALILPANFVGREGLDHSPAWCPAAGGEVPKA